MAAVGSPILEISAGLLMKMLTTLVGSQGPVHPTFQSFRRAQCGGIAGLSLFGFLEVVDVVNDVVCGNAGFLYHPQEGACAAKVISELVKPATLIASKSSGWASTASGFVRVRDSFSMSEP